MPHATPLPPHRQGWAKALTPEFRRDALGLAALLILALLPRALNLHREAAWYDEIITIQFLHSPTLTEFLARCQELTPVPPFNLYQITEYYWSKGIDDSVLSLRLLSLLYATASLAALYGLTRSLFSPRAAEWTLAWVAFIPWHIYISQEIRFYSLTLLLSLLSMWSFTRLAAKPATRTLLLNGSLNWLLCQTHPLAIFLCAAQGLFLVLFRIRRWKSIAAWSTIHATLAISLALFLTGPNRDKIDTLQAWMPKPTLLGYTSSVESFLKITGGLWDVNRVRAFAPFTDWGRALSPALSPLSIALATVTLLACGYTIQRLLRTPAAPSPEHPRLSPRETAALLALWFIIPPLCLMTASYLWRPIYIERYVIYAMPPIYLAIGHALSLQRRPSLRAAALAIPVSLYFAFYFPGPNRIPYDRAVATLRDNIGNSAVVFTRAETAVFALQFYWPGDPPPIQFLAASSAILSGTAPAECWFVISPHRFDDIAGQLRPRGEVSGPWLFEAARPICLLRWRPAAP